MKDIKNQDVETAQEAVPVAPASPLGEETSHLCGGNLHYIEELYDRYLENNQGVDEQWAAYFTSLPQVNGQMNGQLNGRAEEFSHQGFMADLQQLSIAGLKRNGGGVPVVSSSAPVANVGTGAAAEEITKQNKFDALVQAYRVYGHKKAKINPLECKSRADDRELKLEGYGLNSADLDKEFKSNRTYFGKDRMTLRESIELLERTYCSSLGVEFMYLSDKSKKEWFMDKLESCKGNFNFNNETKMRLMERLVAAGGLEASLATKYPGTKRFGLEGGEALIPMTDELAQYAGSLNVKEIVIAMAHRGRLNMLVNILGKKPTSLFDEFEGKFSFTSDEYFGDVKYHQGFSCNIKTSGGEIHMALAFNPSHLEIVSPVAEGSVRARQDRRGDMVGDKVIPVVIHGDAAFSGQGVVTETLQMSQLKGFKTGGTIHIIINNQIGFTVSHVGDARSTEYSSDVAKIIEAPILHVNGDDPEAVIFATRLALEYRMKYHSDVVLDLMCYRRHGHNEADEPAITQPMMYKEIKKHSTPADIYADKLIAQGLLTQEGYGEMKEEYRRHLDNGDHVSLSLASKPDTKLFVDWDPYLGHEWENYFDTSISKKKLQALGEKMAQLPKELSVHRQVAKALKDREEMLAGTKPVDWGYAELLAYATLVKEGYAVRMSGQDSRRGTFSHRQAVLHDQESGESYCPLQHIDKKQARFQIYDSFLSEEAVMAFEYGYAATDPRSLVLWEAQFGDFANGAQVVIDQFLSSGETKWQRLCGLVLLLPHGYEGQGPEHSSARLERFLQLSADNNMQVCVPSTAGQVFHMLRRQIIRPLRKPLVVMMPKSLLRKEISASPLDELCEGHFMPIIKESDKSIKRSRVERVILCSGKLYYELLAHRKENNLKDVAIVRVEQLYPFPHQELADELKKYKRVEYLVWSQEEPMNQGAWYSSKHHLEIIQRTIFPKAQLLFSGRPHAASPAAGYMALHNRLQLKLVDDAFELTSH